MTAGQRYLTRLFKAVQESATVPVWTYRGPRLTLTKAQVPGMGVPNVKGQIHYETVGGKRHRVRGGHVAEIAAVGRATNTADASNTPVTSKALRQLSKDNHEINGYRVDLRDEKGWPSAAWNVHIPDHYGRDRFLSFPDPESLSMFLNGEIVGLRFMPPRVTTLTVPVVDQGKSDYAGRFEEWTERPTGTERLTKPLFGWHYGCRRKAFADGETCFYRSFKKHYVEEGEGYLAVIPAGSKVTYYDDEFRVDLAAGTKVYRLESGWGPYQYRYASDANIGTWIGHTEGTDDPVLPGDGKPRLTLRKAEVPKLKPGESTAEGERWITVHPWGKDEEGVPVLIKQHKDGYHTVIGGAAGKLNGMRLVHVSSLEEAQHLSRKRATERWATKQAATVARENRQLERFKKRATAEGLQGKEVETKAAVQLSEWKKERTAKRTALVEKLTQREEEKQQDTIGSVGEAFGWKGTSLTDVDIEALRKAAQEHTGDMEKADKMVDQVVNQFNRALYSHAKRTTQGLKDLIVTAHEAELENLTGDLAIGDVVSQIMGDAGTGYVAGEERLAGERGLTQAKKKMAAEEVSLRGLLERNEGDQGKAEKALEFIQKRKAAATKLRRDREAIREKAKDLGVDLAAKLDEAKADLDQVQTVGEAAELLAKVKQSEKALRNARRRKAKLLGDFDKYDEIPTVAVVHADDSSVPDIEEARKLVESDLNQEKMTRSMRRLVDALDEQDRDIPIRKHRLAGQQSLLNEVAAQATGAPSVDPLVVDLLGESVAAHVLRRAARATGEEGLEEALKTGLEKFHVDRVAKVADEATKGANALLDQAEALKPPQLVDMTTLMAAQTLASQRADLIRQARKGLGEAIGSLEAGAALNEAFGGDIRDELPVSLGAVSTADALQKAFALGLTRQSEYELETDAQGKTTPRMTVEREFSIHSDGKNRWLTLHKQGLDLLAKQMTVPEVERKRARTAEEIKRGDLDQAGWLPEGISSRPVANLSYEPGKTELPVDQVTVSLSDADDRSTLHKKVSDYVGELVNAGMDPADVAGELHSEFFLSNMGSTEGRDRLQEVVNELVTTVHDGRDAAKVKSGRDAAIAQVHALHDSWRKEHGIDDVHGQLLPNNDRTRDLVYQVVVQDPRLQHAFKEYGDLSGDRGARRAVREYAYEKLFGMNARDSEKLTQELSGTYTGELAMWSKWKDFAQEHPDPYTAIQETLGKQKKEPEQEKTDSMFGEEEAPSAQNPLATVDLSDEMSVLTTAKALAGKLGYKKLRRVTDLAKGEFEDVYPDLEEGPGKQREGIVQGARQRIKGLLRDYAATHIFNTPDAAKGHATFDPDNVHTSSDRWNEFVQSMGHERWAYDAVLDKMKGELVDRFSRGYSDETGHKLRTVQNSVTLSRKFGTAIKEAKEREAHRAQTASEQAKLREREAGKYAAEGTGAVSAKHEQFKEGEKMQPALFPSRQKESSEAQQAPSRVSIGDAAENVLRGMMPTITARHGAAAKQAINMSRGDFVRQQRGIKLLEHNKRVALTMGVGSGKSIMAVGGFAHLHSQGKVKRGIFAVPSQVQSQMGQTAAEFLDPEKKLAWFADPTASAEKRREVYADSGTHLTVVTHQALRDDLMWAMANTPALGFAGNTKAVWQAMREMPELKRNEMMQQALDHHGWNWDMSVVDEGHNLLNRRGKEASGMANAIDALTNKSEYHLSMSADPAKNDSSEVFDLLRKIAPHRYQDIPQVQAPEGVVTRNQFMRRYGPNIDASHVALQREMAPYQYAEQIPSGVERHERHHVVEMGAEQKQAYQEVTDQYNAARRAHKRGNVDLDALKKLSPKSFEGIPEDQHEEHGRELGKALGMLRDSGYRRVLNTHSQSAKLDRVEQLLKEKPPGENPTIVFSHSLGAVEAIVKRLQSAGYRVGKMTGGQTGIAKDQARIDFSPPTKGKEAKVDVLVTSDAGSTGWNGQRANHVIQYDVPNTAKGFEQRNGRADRLGQTRDVSVDVVRTNTPLEQDDRDRLTAKGKLRAWTTASVDQIDDSGLAAEIASARSGLADEGDEEALPKAA